MNRKITFLLLSMLVLASLSFGTSKQNQNKKQVKKAPKQVYFKNCKEARAAGYSIMKREKAEYRDRHDKDGDGVACK